jgi:hypothetical protein
MIVLARRLKSHRAVAQVVLEQTAFNVPGLDGEDLL